MKKLFTFLVMTFLFFGWSGIAMAGRPPGIPDRYKLKKVGTVLINDGTISRGGVDVAMIIVAIGSSAGTATLGDPTIDPSTDGDYGDDVDVVVEVGGAANTTVILDLTESPIHFTNGIEFNDDGNIDGITCYEFRQ